MRTFYFLIPAMLPSLSAFAAETSFSDIASNSGFDVAASTLDELVREETRSKRLQKALESRALKDVQMPVTYFAGSNLVFSNASPVTQCTWNDSLTCRFSVQINAAVQPKSYTVLCKTAYTISDVLVSEMTTIGPGQAEWQINAVEKCWALNGQSLSIAPVPDGGLDGIGKGDDFNPPELVELSYREAEDILRTKLPIFRYCHQRLDSSHPAITGRVIVKYHIAENGSIDQATIHEATFEDEELHACIIERFLRIQLRPPMGGWTGGNFTLSFSR
jgi:hypothetical protein